MTTNKHKYEFDSINEVKFSESLIINIFITLIIRFTAKYSLAVWDNKIVTLLEYT